MKKTMALLLAFTLVLSLPGAVFAATDYSFTIKLGGGKSTNVQVTNHEELAREVLTLVNRERKDAGLDPYVWDSNLVGSAIRRGAEASIAGDDKNSRHIRPDGSEWHTVSEYVRGENLAGGYETPALVVEAWMQSEGHRANVLKTTFTSMAVACVEDDTGMYHWVQHFGVADGSASGSTAGAGSTTAAGNTGSATGAAGASGNVGSDGAVSAAAIQSEAAAALAGTAAGGTASVRTRNASTIAPATLHSLANAAAAAGKGILLYADTTDSAGGVQGRLYVEPAKLKDRTANISLAVYTDSARTAATKSNFERWFNNKVAVVRMEQQGSFGARLQVAAYISLAELDTGNLRFYVYDRNAGTYEEISAPAYSIDSNNFLHFYTEKGGDIVITDRALTVR